MKGIYKITSPSNKVYIGQSHNIEFRLYGYKNLYCKSQPKIYRSLNKYGVDNHQFNILHELPIDISQEVMDNYEIFYMQQYRDCGIELLNIKEGGRGGKHSEETKLKLCKNHKGNLGKKHSVKTLRKMSQIKKGHIVTDETKEKLRNFNLGKNHSEESKKKMSEALKGSKNGFYNKNHSEESKKKMSEALKGIIRKKIPCIYCNLTCAPNMLQRHHNDNCKYKK